MNSRHIATNLLALAFSTSIACAQTTATAPAATTTTAASSPATTTAPAGAKGLKDTAAALSAALVAVPDIKRNPYRVTIVIKSLDNKTEDMPGRDLGIYVAKLKGNLNSGNAADKLLFVEGRQVTEALQQGETGTPNLAIKPDHALYGILYSHAGANATTYILDFKLINLATGAILWQGQFELSSLD